MKVAVVTRAGSGIGRTVARLSGTIQVALGVTYAGVICGSERHLLLGASGIFLFGLTYVYVGLDVLLQPGSRGLGWFSGLVGEFGILLAPA